MTRILLVRHATTDAVGKVLSGRMPGIDLNEEGRKQADALANQFSGLKVGAIYSSPLERTLQTAGAISQVVNTEVSASDDFLEIEYGDWTNVSFKKLEENYLFQRFNSFRSCTCIPNGELMMDAQARIVRGINKLIARHPNETIIIVSHADIIKAALAHYAGIHLDLFYRLEISPASVSSIEIDEDRVKILFTNYTGNLKEMLQLQTN